LFQNSVPTVGMSFVSQSEEGYFGFGQRMVGNDQRGQILYCWSEGLKKKIYLFIIVFILSKQ
jgi:hypothetical protein